MIFNVPGHIEMIRNGLAPRGTFYLAGGFIVKTESRRPNRGIYQVGKDYAVQRKRGVPAEPDIRIVMDRIWEETQKYCGDYYYEFCISEKDAWAEGGYTREDYERLFRELNPKWRGWSRWAFEFHAIEVQTRR